jgi:hypothetical protein
MAGSGGGVNPNNPLAALGNSPQFQQMRVRFSSCCCCTGASVISWRIGFCECADDCFCLCVFASFSTGYSATAA